MSQTAGKIHLVTLRRVKDVPYSHKKESLSSKFGYSLEFVQLVFDLLEKSAPVPS